ncbi:MAG: CBS domain-containing protein, partial [Polaribacter sp.]|nr:CBS domain-containing protein [Polaribacter sp.]
MGSFSEDEIQTVDNEEDNLLNQYHLMHSFFANENDSILVLLKIFASNNTNILPVLNKDKHYIGYYDLCDVLDIFTSIPFFADESQTLVVKKQEKDFSMSEIAQIVETNGAKLLGCFISKNIDKSI